VSAIGWITWEPRGVIRGESNPRSTRAHWGTPDGGPTACGRWVPEDFDAVFSYRPSAPRCRRCVAALAKRERTGE